MALVWRYLEKRADGSECRYEVRSAGRTRRLYSNGVFHSQYNPRRPVAGSVWDLLLLPAFMQRLGSVQRVLVLGVGGGAVIKQLQYFLEPKQILGVELNPVHLAVAERFFDVQGSGLELIEADAVSWLKAYRGPKFDLIIDDLFGEVGGQPARAVSADDAWCRALLKHLKVDGALVMNFDEAQGLSQCGYLDKSNKTLKGLSGWRRSWRLSTPLYSNVVACFSRQSLERKEFRQQLESFTELDERLKGCKLNYSLQAQRLP